MNTSIERRVARLEDAAGGGGGDESSQVVLIAAREHEPPDAAVERWRGEHPDVPENAFFIVLVGVSPKHQEVGSA